MLVMVINLTTKLFLNFNTDSLGIKSKIPTERDVKYRVYFKYPCFKKVSVK